MRFFVQNVDKNVKYKSKGEKMFCHNCGAKLDNSVKFCNKCGTKIVEEDSGTMNQKVNNHQRFMHNETNTNAKNPLIALILSLIIIGLGQFYNGDTKKGVIMLGVGIVSGIMSAGILWFLIAIYSAWDAWMVAKGEMKVAQSWGEANKPWASKYNK